MIDYRSDNTGRAAPEILEALVRANVEQAASRRDVRQDISGRQQIVRPGERQGAVRHDFPIGGHIERARACGFTISQF